MREYAPCKLNKNCGNKGFKSRFCHRAPLHERDVTNAGTAFTDVINQWCKFLNTLAGNEISKIQWHAVNLEWYLVIELGPWHHLRFASEQWFACMCMNYTCVRVCVQLRYKCVSLHNDTEIFVSLQINMGLTPNWNFKTAFIDVFCKYLPTYTFNRHIAILAFCRLILATQQNQYSFSF